MTFRSRREISPGDCAIGPFIADAGLSTDDIRLLVVDDEPEIAMEMKEYLESKGLSCQKMHNAQSAIEEILSTPEIGVVLTDLRMPGMSGLEMLAHLRETLPPERELGVIILTGHSGRDEAIEALQAGAMDFLTKPVSLKQLLHTTMRAVETIRARRTEKHYKEALEAALEKERSLAQLQREFISMASHEFRTPLAIIDSAAQRIIRGNAATEPKELARRVEVIRNAITRMTSLIDTTLNLSQIDEGKFTFNPEPCDLAALLMRIGGEHREMPGNPKIMIDVADLPTQVYGDFAALDQVFSNLVSNAVKYSDSDYQIKVTGRAEGGEVIISIQDHGVGIPDDEIPRLFERFFRASSTSNIPGTGIGLNIVKHFVEAHDGRIEVSSTLGEGSVFTVRLPVRSDGGAFRETPLNIGEQSVADPISGRAQAAERSRFEAKTDAPNRASRKSDDRVAPPKILCVDDEYMIRAYISEDLQDAGYETIEAENGKSGLAAIIEHAPDLVLCDINMPDMSGLELLEALRSDHPEFANLPFVFLSARSNREDIIDGKKLGGDDYITKPVNFDLLRATVQARLAQVSRMEEHKNREMDDLRRAIISMFPHELRTPLNHILGFSEMLMSEALGPLGNSQYREYAGDIHASGAALLDTVTHIVDLLDASFGNLGVELKACDVATMIGSCLKDERDTAERRSITISSNIPVSLPAVRADETLFRQVLAAITSNGIKFNDHSGTLHVAASKDELGSIQIDITDTGIGIPEQDISRVLNAFVQLDTGMSRKFNGMGLGLTRAKILTESMSGQLAINSKVGHGTTVTLRLPSASSGRMEN